MTTGRFSIKNKGLLNILGADFYPIDHLTYISNGHACFLYDLLKGNMIDSYLKVFGCKAFFHVPKEQRSKLDSKSTPCIFVGYGDAGFGYKLWDPKEKKMIRS